MSDVDDIREASARAIESLRDEQPAIRPGLTVAQRFALWSQQLRAARVRRIWITTPAYDLVLAAVAEARGWKLAPEPTLHQFQFNGITVMRREHYYAKE